MLLVANNPNINNFSYNINNNSLTPKCDLNGIIFRTIISGDKTKGEYSILEILFPEGNVENEIPLHIHSRETVIIYVLRGKFNIRYGQKDIEGNEGTVVKIEKGILRSFKNKGSIEGKLLVMYIPAGFENFFKDIAASKIEDFRYAGIDDPIIIRLLEKTYGTKVLFEEP